MTNHGLVRVWPVGFVKKVSTSRFLAPKRHLTQTALGYRMYILWFMAGDVQGVHRTNDPAHEWVIQ